MKKHTVAMALAAMFVAASANAGSFSQYDITDVGWAAAYQGCEYDAANDLATYHYTMTVDGREKDLSHWVLVLDPSLAPVASTGGSQVSFGKDPTTNTYGFKWDDGQAKGTTEWYSVTFNGGCSEGEVSYAVKGGTYYAIDTITGPVVGGVNPPSVTYDIGGVVFIDANRNGEFDNDEPVVPDVTVMLLASDGESHAVTGSDGRYVFSGNLPGDYDVYLPAVSDADDMNEMLNTYALTTHGLHTVTLVDSDLLDVDFGFTLNLTQILNDIDVADPDGNGYSFAGIGKTIGFWKHQHTVAISGKGRAHVDSTTLLAMLTELEGLWLADPFNFGTNKFSTSLGILSARTSDAVELLLKQLVATELNHVSGLGLLDAMSLQSLIIHYAEFVAANPAGFTRADILLVKDVLDAINNSGH